jgi:SAM-dependent methyltransferase
MKSLFGNLSPTAASERWKLLLQNYGLKKATAVCLAMVDDHHVRSFDRKYGVRTSGHIKLSKTSFDPSKLSKATAYGPVNAWGFRKLLRILNLPKSCSFVDLGCGLGRACILAAEYGFAKVTGVELAPELCNVARENIVNCQVTAAGKVPVHIVQGDVMNYCDDATDDVYFMYRPFSLDFLSEVVAKLAHRAASLRKPFTVIYSERLGHPQSEGVATFTRIPAFRKMYEVSTFGQSFFVFRCEASASQLS